VPIPSRARGLITTWGRFAGACVTVRVRGTDSAKIIFFRTALQSIELPYTRSVDRRARICSYGGPVNHKRERETRLETGGRAADRRVDRGARVRGLPPANARSRTGVHGIRGARSLCRANPNDTRPVMTSRRAGITRLNSTNDPPRSLPAPIRLPPDRISTHTWKSKWKSYPLSNYCFIDCREDNANVG
jgi:hypothetical protein